MKEPFNYSDSVQDAVVSELVATAFKSILPLFRKKTKKTVDVDENKPSFEDSILLNHFNELYNWCKELEFIGLGGKPISTIINTIQLDYQYSKNRKTTDDIQLASSIKEDDFIFIPGNIIIEGDPGSGKTTTLKRILYNYFFSLQTKESSFSYPILVRFRSIKTGLTLYTYIATLLGIGYETQQEEYEVEVTKIRMVKKEGKVKEVEERYTDKEIRHRPIYFINEQRIENVLINLLEINNVLLIMDGLDELKPDLFNSIQGQISEIGLKLFHSKIIITSRPNYIKIAYPNFSIYEVGQLIIPQIKLISKLWVKDYNEFIKQLQTKSYFELSNRPLFLCFLILLYIENRKNGDTKLPKSSKDVYEQIIELLVFKWDKERDIKRKSKYSDFDEKKKVRFLSYLSFRLTYIIKEKIFTHIQLVEAYISICPYFELPKDEAELVAEEIENHTGIIIKSMYKKYEFSHLAIQEYLCAVYIIGAPFNEKINKYLVEYTPPLALAVALSTDSSLWLTELILKILNSKSTPEDKTNVSAQILYRLNIESPYFEFKPELGIALMSLCKFCNCKNPNYNVNFDRLLSENINIEKAIFEVLKSYGVSGKNESFNRISFKKKYVYENDYPDQICLPQTSYIIKLLPI
jgi:predicted NACHT family NTPase